MPVAAILPARFVEPFMKLLRDELTKVHLNCFEYEN